jgi:hypothetical protein
MKKLLVLDVVKEKKSAYKENCLGWIRPFGQFSNIASFQKVSASFIFVFLFKFQNIQKKSDNGYLVSRTGFATCKISFNVNY